MFSLANKSTKFIEWIQCIRQQVHDIFQKSNAKYEKHHYQYRVPHKFQMGDKVWLHLQNENLTRPHQKLHPLHYGPYTIMKDMGDTAFDLSIPPFLGLHLVFNVDLLLAILSTIIGHIRDNREVDIDIAQHLLYGTSKH
jgi:hypothetical protein